MKSRLIRIIRGIGITFIVMIVGYFNAFNFLDTSNEKVAKVAFMPERILGLSNVKETNAEASKNPVPTPAKPVTAIKPTGSVLTDKQKFTHYVNSGVIKIDANGKRDVSTDRVSPNTLKTSLRVSEYLQTKGEMLHISCFRTGNNFRIHKNGFAFDISNEKVAGILLPWLVENKESLHIREIIFDGSLIEKNSNYYNYYEGKPHKFNSGTIRNHRNHIHVATY